MVTCWTTSILNTLEPMLRLCIKYQNVCTRRTSFKSELCENILNLIQSVLIVTFVLDLQGFNCYFIRPICSLRCFYMSSFFANFRAPVSSYTFSSFEFPNLNILTPFLLLGWFLILYVEHLHLCIRTALWYFFGYQLLYSSSFWGFFAMRICYLVVREWSLC